MHRTVDVLKTFHNRFDAFPRRNSETRKTAIDFQDHIDDLLLFLFYC